MHAHEIACLIQAKDSDALHDALDDLPVTALIELLGEPWHQLHEDIAQQLGLIADPRASEALLRLALHPPSYLTGWGSAAQCQRKCAYSLAFLGTEASLQALHVLAQSTDPKLQAYGEEGLAHWGLP